MRRFRIISVLPIYNPIEDSVFNEIIRGAVANKDDAAPEKKADAPVSPFSSVPLPAEAPQPLLDDQTDFLY